MAKLQDKIAIITGAASGLGKGIAELFAEEGATVVVADIEDTAGKQLAETIGGMFVHVDVTNPASVEAMIQSAVERYGRIDILLNNAGIDGDQATTANSTLENWRRVMSINMDGVYYGMKYVLPVMVSQGGGVILNTASTVGLNAMGALPAYSASKAGVIHLSKSVAIEYATQNIRVNAICPSVVETPLLKHFIENTPDPEGARQGFASLNPMPGMVTVDAVARAALFLASDDSSFITAVALPIDGGYTAR
ncbi:MAG: SDR family oxidoreductase [Deltaproteobacteria bacterium]|nr:SDR family oxidoreductase [Deltaproteobacteria bacterium]MBW2421283.1 SDR family oxidoreductase [Deltaproteobacteria bacterium]